jgi:hypothetical protein
MKSHQNLLLNILVNRFMRKDHTLSNPDLVLDRNILSQHRQPLNPRPTPNPTPIRNNGCLQINPIPNYRIANQRTILQPASFPNFASFPNHHIGTN